MFTKVSNPVALIGLLASLASPALAQTWTDCNPMEKTCTDDVALGITNYKVDFTQSLNSKIWNHTNGVTSASSEGTSFTIAKRLQSPTIQSVFNIFFGSVSVVMKSAAGQGIISSIVIQSDNLDEIDWEWIGGNNTIAQSNYFGKGNQTSFDRAIYHPVETPNDKFHNYTILWTQESIQWIIDSAVVRTLPYAQANGGLNFPQTPSTVRMGIWAGGDESMPEGTIEWSGGKADYTKVPFNMIVQSAVISDHGTGSAYHWSDKTGSFSSIKSIAGTSSVATAISNPSAADLTDGSETTSTTSVPLVVVSGSTTSSKSGITSDSSTSSGSTSGSTTSSSSASTTTEQSTTEKAAAKFQSLSTGAKVGVAGGAVGGVALVAGLLALCCMRQRKKGAKAREEEARRLEAENADNERYAGMSVKAQDTLPMGAMTPAQYHTGSPITKQDTTYYGVNEIEGVDHDHDDAHMQHGVPPPVYNGTGRYDAPPPAPAYMTGGNGGHGTHYGNSGY